MKDKRQEPDKRSLRKYKEYNFYDAGPVEGGDPEDHALEIQNSAGESLHKLFFKAADPTQLNKCIERAKEWVNKNLDDGKDSSDSPRYSDEDLAFFKEIIGKKLDAAKKELEYLEGLIRKNDDPDLQPSDPVNTAEELEQFARMAERQKEFIGHLESALVRIANKSYGLCRVTGKLIDKGRLTAVPHATLSTEAKKMMDKPGKAQEKKPSKKSKDKKPNQETTADPEGYRKDPNHPQSDKKVSELLTELQKPAELPKVRTCRVCGCTDDNCDQCIAKTGKTCHWVEQDLCSACVVVPEIEVVDDRASSGATDSNAQIDQSPINESEMYFFRKLKELGTVDVSMRIMEVNGKLTVGLMPKGKSTQQPVNITGTAEELDAEFLTRIMPEVKDAIPGLVTNLDEVKKSVQESGRESNDKKADSSTPAATTSTPAKSKHKKWKRPPAKKKVSSAAKKPVVKPKAKPAAKPKPVAKAKPAIKPKPAEKVKPVPKPKAEKPVKKKEEEPLVPEVIKEPSLFD